MLMEEILEPLAQRSAPGLQWHPSRRRTTGEVASRCSRLWRFVLIPMGKASEEGRTSSSPCSTQFHDASEEESK